MKHHFGRTLLIASVALIASCSSAPERREFEEHGASCDLCKRACASRATSPKTYDPGVILSLDAMITACEQIMKDDPSCEIPKDCVDAVSDERDNARKKADGMFEESDISEGEILDLVGSDAGLGQ